MAVRPTLVFVHGGPGLDHHVLRPLAAALPAFPTELLDLPGHGQRPGPSTLPALLRQLRRDLQSFDEAIWVGHSLGAMLLRDIDLTGSTAAGMVWLTPPFGSPPLRTRHRRSSAARDVLEQVQREVGAPCPAFVQAIRRASLRPTAHYPELVGSLNKRVGKPVVEPPRCPTLVITGGRDTVVDTHHVAQLVRSLDLQHEHLPSMGHFPAAGGDDGAADAIRRFAERLARRPSRR